MIGLRPGSIAKKKVVSLKLASNLGHFSKFHFSLKKNFLIWVGRSAAVGKGPHMTRPQAVHALPV